MGLAACADQAPEEVRAAKFIPANDIESYVNQVDQPVDLVFDHGTFFTESGAFVPDAGGEVKFRSFVATQPDGTALRVIVGRHIRIGSMTVERDPLQPVGTVGTGPSLVMFATDGIEVTGRVDVRVGASDSPDCNAESGEALLVDSGLWLSGGGGGGFGTAGGIGGAIVEDRNEVLAGGMGGSVSGSDELVPLRGGCSGRSIFRSSAAIGGAGGGAIQLSSRTMIEVSGTIDVDGASGLMSTAGGGAGGAILLDAPDVVIDDSAMLLARGGGGRAGSTGLAMKARDNAAPLAGQVCVSNAACGNGGDGAAVGIDAADADSIIATTGGTFSVGGGGGGLGRIRVNTASGKLEMPPTAVFAGAFTSGTIATK